MEQVRIDLGAAFGRCGQVLPAGPDAGLEALDSFSECDTARPGAAGCDETVSESQVPIAPGAAVTVAGALETGGTADSERGVEASGLAFQPGTHASGERARGLGVWLLAGLKSGSKGG
jgi:hypothetical protein